MSETITQNNQDFLSISSPATQAQDITGNEGAKQKKHSQPVDALLLAYMLIYESVIVSHKSAFIQAKQVEVNGNIQNKLIQEEQAFDFAVISITGIRKEGLAEFKLNHLATYNFMRMCFGADITMFSKLRNAMANDPSAMQAVVDELQMKNEEVSAIRGEFEGKLNVSRQTAQVSETNLNTVINEASESIQQGGSVMQMLVTLSNQIAAI